MMKNDRQAAILDLIATEDIETQDEMTARLTARGFTVTQATVSRDIKEMRLIKSLGPGGKYRYAQSEGDRDGAHARKLKVFIESVTAMDSAGHVMVIKTLPGCAQSAASALDSMQLTQVLGCVAGDDTIMVVVRTQEAAQQLRAQLQGMLGN
nr:arginine repressor [bacterium]